MEYLAAVCTDTGNVKRVNQDSVFVRIVKSGSREAAFAVICDGMGGLEQGEVASASIVRAFKEVFENLQKEIFLEKIKEPEIRKILTDVVMTENEKIIQYGREQQKMLGSTVTAVLFWQGHYYGVHVGDCRLYGLTEKIYQMTTDQTYVAREVALGHMTKEQAKSDSRRNVLLQCVGVKGDLVPEYIYGKTSRDGVYLLCSDGFRHEVSEKEIYELCQPKNNNKEQQMKKNLEKIVTLNRKRGEKDNITGILIRVWEK